MKFPNFFLLLRELKKKYLLCAYKKMKKIKFLFYFIVIINYFCNKIFI